MLYTGSCHCGRIAFQVEGELDAVVSCNCSICTRKGTLLWAVPHDRLRLGAPIGDAGRYTFNRQAIAHRFCQTCGVQPFAEDVAEGDGRSAYVNVRCLDGIDLASIPTVTFDGRSL